MEQLIFENEKGETRTAKELLEGINGFIFCDVVSGAYWYMKFNFEFFSGASFISVDKKLFSEKFVGWKPVQEPVKSNNDKKGYWKIKCSCEYTVIIHNSFDHFYAKPVYLKKGDCIDDDLLEGICIDSNSNPGDDAGIRTQIPKTCSQFTSYAEFVEPK